MQGETDEVRKQGQAVKEGLGNLLNQYGLETQHFKTYLDNDLSNSITNNINEIKTGFETMTKYFDDSNSKVYENIFQAFSSVVAEKDGHTRWLTYDAILEKATVANAEKERAAAQTAGADAQKVVQAQQSATKDVWADRKKKVEDIFANSNYYKSGTKNAKYAGNNLNQYISDNAGGKYLTGDAIKALAEIFGVKEEDYNSILESLQYIATNYGGIKNTKAFATGSRYIPHSQDAWTQDGGGELIYRTTDGAILTPLNQGDMVFTNDMSRRLWEIANGNIPVGFEIPTSGVNRSNTSLTTNNEISIVLPNVQDYDSFKQALQNDRRFEDFIKEVTIGQVYGNNTLKKRRY